MKALFSACITAALLLAPGLNAEQIQIPLGQQTGVQELPLRGATQQQVRATYGEPLEKSTVGEPPISRWRYANFSIYFEGNYVIHGAHHFIRKHAPSP